MRVIILYILSVICISSVAQSKVDDLNLNKWQKVNTVDEFGDETGDFQCVYTTIGTFSNSATIDSKFVALFKVYKGEITIDILEYFENPIDGYSMLLSYKDNEGNKGKLRSANPISQGSVSIAKPNLTILLNAKGLWKFVGDKYINIGSHYIESGTYKFSVNFDGLRDLGITCDEIVGKYNDHDCFKNSEGKYYYFLDGYAIFLMKHQIKKIKPIE